MEAKPGEIAERIMKALIQNIVSVFRRNNIGPYEEAWKRIYQVHKEEYEKMKSEGYSAYCEWCGPLGPDELERHRLDTYVHIF